VRSSRSQLYGLSGTAFCCWFFIASAAQLLAPSIAVWAIGFGAQALLAIVLVLKKQLNDT
jgi:Flp pilus assembly protein TadB